ncbi:DUF2809 domain-containing protein [soil metagenome]|jgi:hypothetical protein
MPFQFNKNYFRLALVLLFTEVMIGSFVHDAFVRPYGGDFLVVIMLYCLVKSFLDAPVLMAAAGVLVFAYAVEVSQYFQLVRMLGLQHNRLAVLLMGTSFSFTDMLVYTLGIALVILTEKTQVNMKSNRGFAG